MTEYRCENFIGALGMARTQLFKRREGAQYWQVITSIPQDEAKDLLIALLKSMKTKGNNKNA